MLQKLRTLRQDYAQVLQEEKQEKANIKQERDFSIFENMGYKFNNKIYSLNEKHPLSKERFYIAQQYFSDESNLNQ